MSLFMEPTAAAGWRTGGGNGHSSMMSADEDDNIWVTGSNSQRMNCYIVYNDKKLKQLQHIQLLIYNAIIN